MELLFSPIQIGSLKLQNRIVMPPMATFGHGQSEPGVAQSGMVTDSIVQHYEEAAKGGAGLIIVESTTVKEKHGGSEQRGLWSDAHIEGQKRIVDVIHRQGTPCLVQIQTSGVTAKEDLNPRLCISDYDSDMTGVPLKGVEMTVEQIHQFETMFVEAAIRAQKAGYDGVELHGAHGYFLSQTLSPLVNHRTDAYGGSSENRARVASEIAQQIVQACGKDFFIAIRMGVNDPDPSETARLIPTLKAAGIGLFDLSTGFLKIENPNATPLPVPQDYPYSPLVFGAQKVKEQVEAKTVCVGEIHTPQRAEAILQAGIADLVAIGRDMLIDPNWPNKAKRGEPTVACMGCRTRCLWFGDMNSCPARKKRLRMEAENA